MRNLLIVNMGPKGQALVEMAIILPLLMLLVMGIFEFGRAMYIKNTITHSARTGVRTAVVTPNLIPDTLANCTTTTTNPALLATCQSLYSGIKKENTAVNLQIFRPDGTEKTTYAINGDIVKITVTLTGFTPVAPFIPIKSMLSGDTAMRYE